MDHVAEATRVRVLEVAERLGYQPHFGAAALAGGSTSTIGLVAPYFDLWYASQVIAGVEAVLSPSGHDLVIYASDTPESQERFFARAGSLHTRIDGLLLVDFFPEVSRLRPLIESELKLVALGDDLDGVASIAIDNFDAAYRATRHLIDIGHERIAVGGTQQVSVDPSPVMAARMDGYRAALEDADLKVRSDYSLAGMLSIAGGRHAIENALELDVAPTAVFFMADEMAFGAIAQAKARGIHIPTELSIIGFDDHDLAGTFGLTTMRQAVRQMGAMAARRILSTTGSDSDSSHELVPVDLVVRDTTAPPR